MHTPKTSFAPVLYLTNVKAAVAFYIKAFNAKELRRFSNDDGSIHVAEMMIDDAMFHLHEITIKTKLSPETLHATTVELGLFVNEPDKIFSSAINAGAQELTAMQDYDYGYRQGTIEDPFGHQWTFQKKI